jgi:phospholipid-translocating ATPase
VYHGFTEHFGKDPCWWAVLVVVLTAVLLFEVVLETAKRRFWPSMIDVWQELEQNRLR